MESIFHRYRNITILLVVIIAQLILLAWQVKSDNDVPLVRVWAVTAVTPVASVIETVRNGTTGFFSNYFELRNAREQNNQLRTEVDRLRLENQLMKNELASAQRAEALAGFQARTPSKMIGARVIGATPGVGTTSLLIDRGTASGVHRGMAVVTPDGIVGNVVAVFPFASQVLSVTDPGFAAGIESQKNHVHGVLKGVGSGTARVDYVPTGQKIEVGEMLYTSGEDRIFPKGLPVGKVTGVRDAGSFLEIDVSPTGAEEAPEEVLVILDPVHQAIPDAPTSDAPVFLAPDVKPDDQTASSTPTSGTTADKLVDQYKKIGDAQKHVFGEGLPGSTPPNFNLKVPGVNAPADPNAPANGSPAAAAKNGPTTTAAAPIAKPPAANAPATPPAATSALPKPPVTAPAQPSATAQPRPTAPPQPSATAQPRPAAPADTTPANTQQPAARHAATPAVTPATPAQN
jgi:rod shape-determining protein MreC